MSRYDREGHRGSRRDQPQGYYGQREAALEAKEIEEALAYQPRNVEAEAVLLGALLVDNRLMETIGAQLQVEHFFEPLHRRIYARIASVTAAGKLANPVTLAPYFEGEHIDTDEQGNPIGPTYLGYMATLTGNPMVLIGARQMAQQVFELAMMRRMVRVARDMATTAKATSTELDPRKLLTFAETELGDVGDMLAAGRTHNGSYFEEAFADFETTVDTADDGGPPAGIAIEGYRDWNDVVGRMEGGDLIYLGGRPSMGKTGVACAVATGAAEAEEATEFLSLEMKKDTITRRMIANMMFEQGVTSTYTQLVARKLTPEDRVALAKIRERLAQIPLHIDDPKDMAVEELLPWIRRRQRAWERKGLTLKLVVIDYLSLFSTQKQFRSEQEQLSYISKLVKAAARETGVTIVALTQLSRDLEKREDKHPQLSDLRQSGSLEQDADTVVFVYRDEYYLGRAEPRSGDKKYEAWREDMLASRDRLELYSAKRREGALCKRTGYFFTGEQAVRGSDFYQTADMFAGSAGMDFGAGPQF